MPSICGVVETGCVPLRPERTEAEVPFAKLVVGTVNTAIAAAAMRIILVTCFICVPSRWNWPLGREENRQRAQAIGESQGNARKTKQRRPPRWGGTLTVVRILHGEVLPRRHEISVRVPPSTGVKGQLTGLTPLRNIRMEFAVEALYFLLQAH